MNRVMKGCVNRFVQVYLDDINVYSKTFEEHIEHLTEVFRRIREAGLKMQKAKCSFIKKELEFLGHVVSREGLRVDEKKIEKVKNWPRPTTVKEVQAFMGFVNYYRRFIEKISNIAGPLYKMVKKENPKWEWTDEQEKAFNLIKELLCSTQVMRYPDFTKPFRLTTDASKTGLGAVLEQVEDNGEVRPIAFASKSLNPAEIRYSTTELELYAIKWAMAHFRHYLMGKPFEVYTDHQALTGIVKLKDQQNSRINRYLHYMTEFDYKIKYVPGKANKAADALSRKVYDFLEERNSKIKVSLPKRTKK
jgi:hypothetical protein